MKIKSLVLMSGIFLFSAAEAGLWQTTVHSRANCLNNESITWWWRHPYNWRVISIHYHKGSNSKHHIDTGFNYNDRVAGIHWGEGVHGGFEVWGYHYLREYHRDIPFDQTYATTCNIIDGWD